MNTENRLDGKKELEKTLEKTKPDGLAECGECGSRHPATWFHSCPVGLKEMHQKIKKLESDNERLAALLENLLREDVEGQDYKEARKYLELRKRL